MNYLVKNITSFQNKRNKFLKNQEYISIIIYYLLLFIIDYSGYMNLYGQNIIRRTVNMFKRIDPLNYNKFLNPFCIKYDKLLNKDDILKLQSIKLPKTIDMGLLTRTNTITHQCCNNYSEKEKKIIDIMVNKIKIKYEKKINKKLYKFNEATIYQYKGNKSKHLWHVDPRNINEIYNVIVCIKKIGNISPLQCKNKDNSINSIHFNEGDAGLFNGGTTIHQVPPNNDPNSERTVLSVAFTSNKKLVNNDIGNNLCVYIGGGNNIYNLLKIFFLIFILNLSLTFISGINILSYKFLIIYFIVVILLNKYIPYLDLNIGTGRPSSICYNLLILLYFILTTISIKGAIIFFSYFLLSDLFFKKKWVAYE